MVKIQIVLLDNNSMSSWPSKDALKMEAPSLSEMVVIHSTAHGAIIHRAKIYV
jgi:hypothetical protein